MKALGMVRKVDELGRVVIPAEVRRNLEIDTGTSVEMFTDDEGLFIRKYVDSNRTDLKYKAIELLENMYDGQEVKQSDVLEILKYVRG